MTLKKQPFYLIGERAKRARHYQGCTNSRWCGIYIHIYIYVWKYVCHNSSACHAYIMWAELGHSKFFYGPAVSNVVTNGNGMGTKKILKGTVRLGLSLVSSFCLRRYYCSESKPILYLNTVYCKFLLYVSVEIDPFSCEQHQQFSTQTNFLYLGLVNVNMITGTCCS